MSHRTDLSFLPEARHEICRGISQHDHTAHNLYLCPSISQVPCPSRSALPCPAQTDLANIKCYNRKTTQGMTIREKATFHGIAINMFKLHRFRDLVSRFTTTWESIYFNWLYFKHDLHYCCQVKFTGPGNWTKDVRNPQMNLDRRSTTNKGTRLIKIVLLAKTSRPLSPTSTAE